MNGREEIIMKKETLRKAISQLDDNIIERGMQPVPKTNRRISRTIITTVVAAELVIAAVGVYALTREKPDIVGESSISEVTTPADGTDISTTDTNNDTQQTVISTVTTLDSTATTATVITTPEKIETNENLKEEFNSNYFSWDEKAEKYTYIANVTSPDFLNIYIDGRSISYFGEAKPEFRRALLDLESRLPDGSNPEGIVSVGCVNFGDIYDKANKTDAQAFKKAMATARKAAINDFDTCFVYTMKQEEGSAAAGIALEDVLKLKGKLYGDILSSGRLYYTQAEAAVDTLHDSLTPKQVDAMVEVFGYLVAPALEKYGLLDLMQTPDDLTAKQLVEFANHFSPYCVGEIMEQQSYPLHDGDQMTNSDIMLFASEFAQTCIELRKGEVTHPDFSAYVKNARLNEYMQSWADVQRTQMALDMSYDTTLGIETVWKRSTGFGYSHYDENDLYSASRSMGQNIHVICTTDDFKTVLVSMQIMPVNHSGEERAVINSVHMLLRKENGVITMLDFEDDLFKPLDTNGNPVSDILATPPYDPVRKDNYINLESENFWNTETSVQELYEMKKFAAAVAEEPTLHKELHDYIIEDFENIRALALDSEFGTLSASYKPAKHAKIDHVCIYEDPWGSHYTYFSDDPLDRRFDYDFIDAYAMLPRTLENTCMVQITKVDNQYHVSLSYNNANGDLCTSSVWVFYGRDGFTCTPINPIS